LPGEAPKTPSEPKTGAERIAELKRQQDAKPMANLSPYQRKLGQFMTPHPEAYRIAELADVNGKTVLDPTAGEGRFLKYAKELGASETMGVEIDSGLATFAGVRHGNFMDIPVGEMKADVLLMNPPFTTGGPDTAAIVDKAINEHWTGKGAAVLILPAGPSGDKVISRYQHLVEREEDLPEDAFKKEGTGVRTKLYILKKKQVAENDGLNLRIKPQQQNLFKSMKKSFTVGTVRQWSDGKSYKKIAAGKWEPTEALPKKAMGLKLPEKGIAYEPVTSGTSIVARIVKNAPASSDQAHANLDKLYADSVKAQPVFQKLIDSVGVSTRAEKTMHGPPKDRDRAEEKIELNYGGDAAKINDLVRASLSYNKVADVYKALDKLSKTKGIEIVLVKDRIAKPISGGYRDVSLKVKVEGHVCELQLHLGSVMKAKQGAHKLYEEIRSIAAKAKGEGRKKFSLREMKRIAVLTKLSEKTYGDAFRQAK